MEELLSGNLNYFIGYDNLVKEALATAEVQPEQAEGFRRVVQVEGEAGERLRLLLHGPKGTVQLTASNPIGDAFTGDDLGYHSPRPLNPWDQMYDQSCKELEGLPCYYDGSGLAAEQVWRQVVACGVIDTAWTHLKAYYHSVFDSGREVAPENCVQDSPDDDSEDFAGSLW